MTTVSASPVPCSRRFAWRGHVGPGRQDQRPPGTHRAARDRRSGGAQPDQAPYSRSVPAAPRRNRIAVGHRGQSPPSGRVYASFRRDRTGVPEGDREMRGLSGRTLRLYKRWLSPLLPSACRFHPTCSEYMMQAVEKHGVARGVWLGIRRLLRCHPFHQGGFDPVR